MNRRDFLKAAAAAPCVFGLRDLLAQETDLRPAWFRLALARMKEGRLHGVVVLAPEADPAQKEFGERAWDLLSGDSAEAHELMLTSVFIFTTPAVAESCGVRKAGEDADRFLLDPEGNRVAAEAYDRKSLLTAEGFVASFTPFIHGDSGQRLKSRGEALEASAPAGVKAALRDLGADEVEVRATASAVLARQAADLLPLYAWKRRTATDPEVSSRLKSIIEAHYRSLAAGVPGPRLPFGTRMPKFRNGECGVQRELLENEDKGEGPMVACGRGRVDGTKTRMFLRFLTK